MLKLYLQLHIYNHQEGPPGYVLGSPYISNWLKGLNSDLHKDLKNVE